MKKYHLPLMPVIWGITCLTIGILVAIGLYSYFTAEKSTADQFNQRQLVLAKQAAQGMESFLAGIQVTAGLLAQRPEVQDLKGNGPGGSREETLRTLSRKFGGPGDFFFWLDAEGTLAPRPSAKLPAETEAQRSLLRGYAQKARLTGRPVVGRAGPPGRGEDPANLPAFGSILVLTPVFSGSSYAGLLGWGIDFQSIYDRFVHALGSGARGASWMIDPEGTFIAHHDPGLVGQDAFSSPKQTSADPAGEPISRVMKKKMMADQAGVDVFTSAWPPGGPGRTKKLIAYAPVRAGDQVWLVALVVPYSDVTRVVWGSFQNSAVLLFIMACTLLAGTYVGHKINQERTRAEEKVKWGEEILRSQNRLQALFDGAPDAITLVDRDYRILMVNKTGLNWYRKPLEEFAGKPCHEKFQNRPGRCPNCPAEESFRTGLPAFRERASLAAGGQKYFIQIFTFPLRDRSGRVVEVVEYIKDVTAEKELQEQILQSERLAVVGRMAANVAHEIKNPLGTIVLNAELLEEELEKMNPEETSEAREVLGVIKSEVDRLSEVVEEYLQFARLPKVKLEKGRANAVISDLLSFLREELEERKILAEEDLDPGLPAVDLDPRQLRQALLNIIKNSLEAMPEGGKLTVSTARREGKVEITIMDTGKGISEEEQDLVFTPFFSTKHGGTGLGLSITSHIIKEHRGTIGFRSYPGLGTSFTLRLPIPLSTQPPWEEEAQAMGPAAGWGKAS